MKVIRDTRVKSDNVYTVELTTEEAEKLVRACRAHGMNTQLAGLADELTDAGVVLPDVCHTTTGPGKMKAEREGDIVTITMTADEAVRAYNDVSNDGWGWARHALCECFTDVLSAAERRPWEKR